VAAVTDLLTALRCFFCSHDVQKYVSTDPYNTITSVRRPSGDRDQHLKLWSLHRYTHVDTAWNAQLNLRPGPPYLATIANMCHVVENVLRCCKNVYLLVSYENTHHAHHACLHSRDILSITSSSLLFPSGESSVISEWFTFMSYN
jgi:hypothetical protein